MLRGCFLFLGIKLGGLMKKDAIAKEKKLQKKLSQKDLSRYSLLINGRISELEEKLVSLNGSKDSNSELMRKKHSADLKKFKLAQEAVREKTFGFCEECNGKIPNKRLEAIFPLLCRDCLEGLEKLSKR